jgi:hypothetical protein
LYFSVSQGLLIENNKHRRMKVYTDADWASCQDDWRSTSGHCAFVGRNLVSWRSKKHNVMARFTVEPEYRAMAFGVSERGMIVKIAARIGIK